MAVRAEDWDAVGKAIEGLGLKLKLHFEEVASEGKEPLKSATDKLGDAVERSFDALRAAVHDPAIKENVKEVATLLRDAVANTMSEHHHERDADRHK